MKEHEVKWVANNKETGEVKQGVEVINEPENVEEAIELWGEEKLLSLAIRMNRLDVGNSARSKAFGIPEEVKERRKEISAKGRLIARLIAEGKSMEEILSLVQK